MKSVITCDTEGRITTFNAGAAAMFGWQPDEVIGKKRVSLFSPGEVVLEHVPRWLGKAVADGEMSTQTVFLRKDGTPFAAQIRITPTYSEGVHIGYCGVTEPLPDVPVDSVRPPIALSTRIFRWLVVTRAPFLTASLVPVLLGAALAARAGAWSWLDFALALCGALALHVGANTFNDYFDWTSGTDQANNDYFLPFSGGSRAVELGLVSPAGLWRIGAAAFGVAALCGALLIGRAGTAILVYGGIGAFAAYFYTAPPLRLAARRGLGELFVGLCFGPLMTAGTFTALTGRIELGAFATGLPVGLLTAAILCINEFPDAPSDARSGKNHLVVVLGKRAARWGYALLLAGTVASAAALIAFGTWPPLAAAALLAAPLGVRALRVLWSHYDDRALVAANRATILLHLAAGLLMTGGVLWG